MRLVTVCASCCRASCWQGLFFCDDYMSAGTVELPISKLLELGLEDPSYWGGSEPRKYTLLLATARNAGMRGRRCEMNDRDLSDRLFEDEDPTRCRGCGCDDDHTCQDFDDDGNPKPCHWVEVDLCSACVGKEVRRLRDEVRRLRRENKLLANDLRMIKALNSLCDFGMDDQG